MMTNNKASYPLISFLAFWGVLILFLRLFYILFTSRTGEVIGGLPVPIYWLLCHFGGVNKMAYR